LITPNSACLCLSVARARAMAVRGAERRRWLAFYLLTLASVCDGWAVCRVSGFRCL